MITLFKLFENSDTLPLSRQEQEERYNLPKTKNLDMKRAGKIMGIVGLASLLYNLKRDNDLADESKEEQENFNNSFTPWNKEKYEKLNHDAEKEKADVEGKYIPASAALGLTGLALNRYGHYKDTKKVKQS